MSNFLLSGRILAVGLGLAGGLVAAWPAQATEPAMAAGRVKDPAVVRTTLRPETIVRFEPGVPAYFMVAAGVPAMTPGQLRAAGLHGQIGSISRVYDDGNNRQVTDDERLEPGRLYMAGFDRDTLIDFRTGTVSQAAKAQFSLPAPAAPSRLAGSPDDGTKVVLLYDETYRTRRYKCWSGGKSGAWDGLTDAAPGADNVKNAGVVRRGLKAYIQDGAGMTGEEPVAVYAPAAPGQTRTKVAWTTTYDSARKAFAVNIPADAPVGDYQVAVGSKRENYVTMYVIFDPNYAQSALSVEEMRSHGYTDEDWERVAADKDYLNHVFEGPSGTTVYGYRGDTNAESGADGGVFGQRMVEVASHIHGAGARTTLEAAVHAYVVMGQRLHWTSGQGYYGADGGVVNSFDKMLLGNIKAPGGVQTRDELNVAAAEKAALGLGWKDRLPQSYVFAAGQCFNYGTNLAAMLRALGIPSRAHYTANGGGWPGSFHVWAEAYLDRPEIHPTAPDWWKSHWYKFDANRQYNLTGASQIAHLEGNIAPIVIDGFGDYLLNEYKKCNGISYKGSYASNASKCTSTGSGSHAGVLVKKGTTASVTTSTSGIYQDAASSSAPWAIQDLFTPYNGPTSAPTQSYVVSSVRGYALNDSQSGRDGGKGFIDDGNGENDLPPLQPGVPQRTIVGGHGFAMFRVPVAGRAKITIKMTEGVETARVFATYDRMIYSTGRRYELNHDAQSDAQGVLALDTAGRSQVYLWVENKFSHTSPGIGQEVTWVTLLDGDGGVPDDGLKPGVPVNGIAAARGESKLYTMKVPAGARNLSFTLSGGTGDADLYVQIGRPPTDTDYDCRPYAGGSDEQCLYPAPAADTYHVRIKGYSAYSGVQLVANYTVGGEAQTYANNEAVPIVDLQAVESRIVVAGRNGQAPNDASVAVDIGHSYRGDLRVELIAPDGSAYLLHDRKGGSADDLKATYTLDLSSEPLNGTWRLRVHDAARGDEGSLRRWSITF